MSERFVVGRDRELAQLDLAIGDGRDGLRLAKVSGPSGLGKTTIAETAVDRAHARGFETLIIRGRAGSLSTPFAPVLEALPALSALLDLTSNADADADQFGLALVQLVTELADGAPQLILVDDAQALDESTIAVLPYLSGISDEANVSLLFIEQTDAMGIPASFRAYVDGLLARRVVSHLELGPMSADGLRQIAANALDVDAEDVPAEVVERAQGNPWFVRELAVAWKQGSNEIPSSIAAAATSRLYALPEQHQELVSALSVSPEGLHIEWLENLAAQRPREFVATMERILATGIVREDGEVLTIAHPLMQQAIVSELSTAMRRATHLEIVDAIRASQLDEVVLARTAAFHLAAAGRRDEAISSYLTAATTSEILGKFHEARADYLAALHHETRIDERIDALRRTALLSTQLGTDDASELWQDLGRLAASKHDDPLYAFALYQAFHAAKEYVPELVRRASSLDAESNGWAALASAMVELEAPNYAAAEAACQRAIIIGTQSSDRLLVASAERVMGTVTQETGRAADAIRHIHTAVDHFIALRVHNRAVLAWFTMIYAALDDADLTRARDESEAVDQYVVDLGLDHFRPHAMACRAFVLSEVGDLEQALALSSEAVRMSEALRNNPSYSPHSDAFVTNIRAKIANDMGAPNAQEFSAHGAEIADITKFEGWIEQAKYETYRSGANRNGLDKALDQITELEASDEPIFVAIAVAWTLRTAVLTESSAGIERVREIRAKYDKWDMGKRVQMFRDEIDAVLKVVDGGDPIALNEIANAWSEVGCALDALKVNAMSGAFLVRRGDKEAAKTFLQTAKNGLQTCGASGDADLVAALLRQTGARSRAKSRTTSVGPLTKRELEIARLVASGLKNSEVAGTLFLAEKTVAAHLSNIYGKVEVRSRVQLGQWIRENDTEFDAALVG